MCGGVGLSEMSDVSTWYAFCPCKDLKGCIQGTTLPPGAVHSVYALSGTAQAKSARVASTAAATCTACAVRLLAQVWPCWPLSRAEPLTGLSWFVSAWEKCDECLDLEGC